jgi:hypothetical protein
MRTNAYAQKKYHIIFTQYFSWHQENNSLKSTWEDHYAESYNSLHMFHGE